MAGYDNAAAMTTAVILAGGEGRRIAPLYRDIPKPMIPATGRPFLYWVTAWAVAHGVTDIVYATGHLADEIEAWVAAQSPKPGITLHCRREPRPLGTGGGVVNCLNLCAEQVLVLNGDSLVAADMSPAFVRFSAERLDGVILTTEVADAARFGSIEVDKTGLLRGFYEKRPGRGLVNGGVYLFRKALLASHPLGRRLSLEYDIIPAAIASGARIAVHPVDGPMLDIGTPETVDLASTFIESHRSLLPDFTLTAPGASGRTIHHAGKESIS